MESQEIVGSFVFGVIMLLSNIGGIGGGGVAIPLIMVFFHFPMKAAITISSFAIFCSSLTRFIFNFRERHPEKDSCVVIDYGMTNVMMPLILIGSLTGAYIYLSFPDIILEIILTIILLILTIQSFRKFLDVYRKETMARLISQVGVAEKIEVEAGKELVVELQIR